MAGVLAERRASLLRPIARTITLCVTKLAAQRLKPTGCERWKLLQLRWAVGVHGNGPSPLGSSSTGSSNQYAKIIDQNVHVMFPEAYSAKPNSASNAHPGKRRHRANTGAPHARFHRTHGTADKRCCRPRGPALSLCRHPRDDGETGVDYCRHAASWRGLSGSFCRRTTRSAKGLRHIAT